MAFAGGGSLLSAGFIIWAISGWLCFSRRILVISRVKAAGSSTSAFASASGLSRTMAMSISPPSFWIRAGRPACTRRPDGSVGMALVLPALTDCRWWFESLLVHSGVSSATRRKATGADHKKKGRPACTFARIATALFSHRVRSHSSRAL